ncbi:UEV-domain-containing protein [Trichodelitschia bisporula]|uniref:UEV-domain-containing protein n=1 Tax=Trichodelitschia bisporula TaxID=703511 RepID=A0A6G1HNT2_9PEZI|nr:UEV-domain-containing protein [Trichodelitschia bisporula]
MSVVPDKVLNWLYSVLTNEYTDVNRTYSDVAQALSQYPSLSPRTEVYTFENGSHALLLLLSGTLPVQFRDTLYRFPVALWIPHTYPKAPPMVYVTPAQGMLVRPGQHVSPDGRVYHPYLAQWAKFWDKSSIYDFLAVLRGVFAKDPPVMAAQQRPLQPQPQATPPPVPPTPEEWRKAHQPPPPQRQPEPQTGPPPLPPKADSRDTRPQSVPDRRDRDSNAGPPLPPLPPHPPSYGERSYAPPAPPPAPYPHRHSSVQSPRLMSPPQQPNTHITRFQASHHELESPVSPIFPEPYRQYPPHAPPAAPQRQPFQTSPPPNQPYFPSPPQPHQQPTPKPRKPPPIDLLSSPLDVTLAPTSPPPAPPIPPNPEKEHLLHSLSATLVDQTTRILNSNAAALQPLQAQQSALHAAHATLAEELSDLQFIDATLAANERILRDAMRDADAAIRDSARRRRPEVDEVLVCPTVVGGQVYGLVAEARACEEARVALARGLDAGRVGLEAFVKQTRSLAREEFLKKALVRKIALGVGLDLHGWKEPGGG